MKFSRDVLKELLFNSNDFTPFQLTEDSYVFMFNRKYYEFTENCDKELVSWCGFNSEVFPEIVECHEVEPYEVTVTKWRVKK